MLSQIAALYYFAHFLIILPIVSSIERPDAAALLDHRGGARRGRKAAPSAPSARLNASETERRDHDPHLLHPRRPVLRGSRCAWSLLSGNGRLSAGHRAAADTVERAFHEHPKAPALASDGVFGKFDQPQLQRGFQVYKEVCSACHSLKPRRVPRPAGSSATTRPK